MSAAPAATATATTDVADAAPVKKRWSMKRLSKKMIVIIAVLALLLAAGGGAAYWIMKKRAAAAAAAAAAEEGGDAAAAVEVKPARPDLKSAPTFVPLDPFTVNLADRETERYAQIGITFELADAKAGELLKAYMPAIRNNILLALGSKTAAQLNERDGKLRLAAEIRREALRPLGYDIKLPAMNATGTEPRVPKQDDDEETPIRAVHFSNFIIQ